MSGDSLFYIEIISSIFERNIGEIDKGGAFSCTNCEKVIVSDSTFRNLNAIKGGAIHLEEYDYKKIATNNTLVTLIQGCKFY